MRFDLILDTTGLSYYGDIPYAKSTPDSRIESLECFSLTDIDLMVSIVDELDVYCNALLDLGDVDYFSGEKLKKLEQWILYKLSSDKLNYRLREILNMLLSYAERGILLGTGVVVEL